MTTNARTCPTCGIRLPLGVLGCAACDRSSNAGLFPIAAAAGAAVAGALVWGGLTWVTGYEVGYVAWGIGLLVGASAVWAGGRGRVVAATCAVLALAAIVGGRLTCIELARQAAATELRNGLTPELHAAQLEATRELAKLGDDASDDAIRAFLAEQEEVDEDEIGEMQIAEFREQAKLMRQMLPATPMVESFGEWREQVVEAAMGELGHVAILRESLSAIDILFALLGITTAFGLVMGRTRQEQLAAAARAPQS